MKCMILFSALVLVACSTPTAWNGSLPEQNKNMLVTDSTGHQIVPPQCPNNEDEVSSVRKISSNFGCATQRNIGLMIADPNDVQDSDKEPMRDAAHAARTYHSYRTGATNNTDESSNEQ